VTLWKRLSGRYGRASPEGVEVGPCQLHKIILYGDVSSFRRKRLVSFLKLIRIIGIIQFTNFYNYNLWIKLF